MGEGRHCLTEGKTLNETEEEKEEEGQDKSICPSVSLSVTLTHAHTERQLGSFVIASPWRYGATWTFYQKARRLAK